MKTDNIDLSFPESLKEKAARLFPMGADEARDHKAWAKRLVWRHQQGDSTLRPIQVRFAREALGETNEHE